MDSPQCLLLRQGPFNGVHDLLVVIKTRLKAGGGYFGKNYRMSLPSNILNLQNGTWGAFGGMRVKMIQRVFHRPTASRIRRKRKIRENEYIFVVDALFNWKALINFAKKPFTFILFVYFLKKVHNLIYLILLLLFLDYHEK